MNRGHRNCEICGIQEIQCSGKVFFARFPSCEHICKQWVKVVGKEDLLYLPIEKLHDLRYVCGRHFENRHYTKTKTRLKKNAVPTLQLTKPPLHDELLEGFPIQKARENQGLHPPAETAPEQRHQNEIATKNIRRWRQHVRPVGGWRAMGRRDGNATLSRGELVHASLVGSALLVAVATGHYHSAAMDAGGRLYTLGWGVHGQLGRGSIDDKWTRWLGIQTQHLKRKSTSLYG